MNNHKKDNFKTITYTKIIDLTHIIDTNIPIWPGDPPVEFQTVAKFEQDGYHLRKFSLGEHSGTHINAPNSFYQEKPGIESYSPTSLVVSANMIDIRNKTTFNADYVLKIDDIKNWENQHQTISEGTLLLLQTGWQKKWGNSEAFFNQDNQGKLHFPGFGENATKFLLEERGIIGVGIDTHGVDPGIDHKFTTNKLILSKSGIVLENLNNLDQLPPTNIILVIGIIRLRGGSGTPVSVLAFI